MMRVLIIKTSSLGDVIHTLPALSDAQQQWPEIRFDWVVEEAFAEIPAWHSAVAAVIPVALRRWRRHPLPALRSGEWQRLWQQLRRQRYSHIIDAQGLLKSACLSRLASGQRYGLDWQSAREPLASLAYQSKFEIARDQHAVARVRALFARALAYPEPSTAANFGIARERQPAADKPYLVFLHATTWPSKHWPEAYWQTLVQLAGQQGYQVKLPGHSEDERLRAERIAQNAQHVTLLARLSLNELAGVLANAAGVVGVDTGPAHLGAALGVPGVTLYGATHPDRTGVLGCYQQNLTAVFDCAPCLQRQCHYHGPSSVTPACYASLSPKQVMATLTAVMRQAN